MRRGDSDSARRAGCGVRRRATDVAEQRTAMWATSRLRAGERVFTKLNLQVDTATRSSQPNKESNMTTRTTTKTAPAKGLRESRKEQAAARKPAAAAKATAKPAAKTAPAKPTPAKKAAAPKSDTTEKRAYSAT